PRTRRFNEFSANVLPSLSKVGKTYLERAAAAISDGASVCDLHFEIQSPSRRDEAISIFNQWRELYRRIGT
ncbi:hypothetical protein, partial [Acinetobacter baumannii]|uniref:hypothetical protein n=1 Tax=Acinetobacter baumannii TaxID=470 RepID=UPI001C08CB1B